MIHRTQPTSLRPLTMTLLAGATITLLGLSGCGESNEAQSAVKQAGRSFTSVAVGDANATPEFSEQTYEKAVNSLSPHAGDSDGYAEAAAIGVAMAKKGQAALASQRAAQIENEARHQARVIRGMINEWLTMNAISKAAGMFDPSSEIKELEGIIELRKDDISSYQQQMELINEEISQHESKIATLKARADEQRNQAGAIELQMPRVSAQEAAKLAAQVREFSLRADQYELEAVRIEGVVGQLRPGAREVSLNVEKARSQVELLNKAVAELRDRAQASRLDAQQARENADAAVERIESAVAAYQSLRDTSVQEAHDEAIKLARDAINAVRDARDAIKQGAALNKADAQQLLAEFSLRQAGGEHEEAQLYMALDESGISGDWGSRAQAATAQAQELTQAAQQSYLDAAASLRAARVRGDVGERLESTAKRLEMLGGLEPEPEYIEQDEDAESYDDADDMSTDSGEMTLEDILANTPEEMRETVRAQLQGMIDTLEATDDVDTLYEMLDQIDAQSEATSGMLPPEMQTEELLDQMNAGFNWVKRQIEARIQEIENG